MKYYILALLLTFLPGSLLANDSGLVYTGKAKSWSIETQNDGYHFECFDETGNTYININPTTATNTEAQIAEVIKQGSVSRDDIKTYKVHDFSVYEFNKPEWPTTNYHIYLKLKNRMFVVRWFDMPNKPGSGKAIFDYLRNIKPKPNKILEDTGTSAPDPQD